MYTRETQQYDCDWYNWSTMDDATVQHLIPLLKQWSGATATVPHGTYNGCSYLCNPKLILLNNPVNNYSIIVGGKGVCSNKIVLWAQSIKTSLFCKKLYFWNLYKPSICVSNIKLLFLLLWIFTHCFMIYSTITKKMHSKCRDGVGSVAGKISSW